MNRVWLVLLLFGCLFSGGCWDMREINDLGFVTAVGVDKAKPPNKFRVTVQIANASSTSAKSEQGQAESGMWVGTEEGKSIFDAIRNLVRISSRRVMWAHNNVIIVGESLAKESVSPVADFFTHNPELRMKTPVVVSKGEAKDYLLAKAGMETPSGLSFIYFRDYSSLLGETVQSSMLTLSSALATKYVEPLIAAINLKKMEAPPDNDNKSGGGKESKIVDVAGTAVFKRDKMIGWLSPQETRGMAWIKNETQNVVVTVRDPLHGNQNVTVETKGIKAEITTKVAGDIPLVTIKIKGAGSIVEEDGQTHHGIETIKKEVEGLLNRQIAENIKLSLNTVQKKYKSDVIGLAAIIHGQHNWEWEGGLKYKWEEIYPKVPFKVSVSIRINSNTLKQLPAKYIK